jgi:hypothetical protein
MKAEIAALAVGLGLAAFGAAVAQPTAKPGPDLKQCGTYKLQEGDQELERKAALPVPVGWHKVMATNRDFMAVTTIAGKTLCLFTREWENIDPATITNDSRYVGFAWSGYEAGGYILIDRAGKGGVFETGARPLWSRSGRRLGSVEWSESGFGSLNGILVLGVDVSSMHLLGEGAETLRELARITDLPEGLTDWRNEGWRGDWCLEASAFPYANDAARKRFSVRQVGGKWGLVAGACPAA